MILLQILDHDLHRARRGIDGIPIKIEIPARPQFLPALVSGTRGQILTARSLREGKIWAGVFPYDSDRIDDVIPLIMDAAYSLSIQEEWSNIFLGKKASQLAFNYIRDKSAQGGQPHIVLIPDAWPQSKVNKFLGSANITDRKYRKFCTILPCKVSIPVFCSRPDMVGMYTQFLGGHSSILIHNVKYGLAFCAPTGDS